MYKIIVRRAAEKFIRKQPVNIQQKLYHAINSLPYGTDIKKLSGFQFKFRKRIGNYRILYDKYDDKYVIDVVDVDNRGQIYKRLQ